MAHDFTAKAVGTHLAPACHMQIGRVFPNGSASGQALAPDHGKTGGSVIV